MELGDGNVADQDLFFRIMEDYVTLNIFEVVIHCSSLVNAVWKAKTFI